MQVVRHIAGIVHWHDDDLLIRSRGRTIDLSRDNGQTFQRIGKIDLDPLRNLASATKLGRRLVRANVKHIGKLDNGNFIAFAGKGVYSFGLGSTSIERLASINGSRPLRLCFHDEMVFYGEYRSNPERTPVHVWGSSDQGNSWQVIKQFEGVRHVHGVYRDPHEDCFWVTTGDLDEEAAIWKCDSNWNHCEKVLSGSQQSRVIDLLFTRDSIYYGTDAPHEPNWLVRLDRASCQPENLMEVAGPIFHAKAHNDQLFFSTAREPSEVNCSNEIQLWRVSQQAQPFMEKSFSKDRWNMKYFQYGQISFADGPGKNGLLWISPFATRRNDQSSYLLKIEDKPQ